MPYLTDALESIDETLEELDGDRARLQAARDALEPPRSIEVGAGERYRHEPKRITLPAALEAIRSTFGPIFDASSGAITGGAFEIPGVKLAAYNAPAEEDDRDADPDPEPAPIEPGPELAASREDVDAKKRAAGRRGGRRGGRRPSKRREAIVAIVNAHEEGILLTEILEELEPDLRPTKGIEGIRLIVKAATAKGEIVKVAGPRSNSPAKFFPADAIEKRTFGDAGRDPASPPRNPRSRPRPASRSSEPANTLRGRVLEEIDKADHPLALGELCKSLREPVPDVGAALSAMVEAGILRKLGDSMAPRFRRA